MNTHSEIDEVLARLGSVEPPAGLARRVEQRLEAPRQHSWLPASFRSWFTLPRAMAACAVAASVAASALIFDPALRNFLLPHHGSAQTVQQAEPPRVAPSQGNFGSASKILVPADPVPVPPSPVNHGRGHARSGRMELPSGSQTALPRGVKAPAAVPAQ
jgi:hypothetical protein